MTTQEKQAEQRRVSVDVGHVPAGVAFAFELCDEFRAVPRYTGASFCAAVRAATSGSGRALRIEPDSLNVCRWAPVVLGLREPDARCDLKVEFCVPSPVASVLIAPVDWFPDTHPPDVVLVRALPSEIRKIVKALGPEKVNFEMGHRLDRSALNIFSQNWSRREKSRVQLVNGTLAVLNGSPLWRRFTKWIFRHGWTTYYFNLLLKRFLANMSMCRNGTVIPHLTQRANVSYFCTGGIAWGQNRPGHMVCGIPFEDAKNFEWHVGGNRKG